MSHEPLIYTRGRSGHRESYLAFARRLLGGEVARKREMVLSRRPVLFLMVEDNFGLYGLTALLRALTGRRTVGLLFRPGPAATGATLRLRMKRMVLRLLRHVTEIRTLSIVPAPLDLRFGAIVDDWIHDFQLWDLLPEARMRITELRAGTAGTGIKADALALFGTAREHAAERPLLVAVGTQSRGKGIELLAASMREGGTLGWAVLVAGRFTAEATAARDAILAAGGLVIDRYLTDSEIEAVYAAADAVWCLYDPSYDQASGILGRAVQLGVPAVVRQTSLSAAVCRELGAPHIAAVGGADISLALAGLPLADAVGGQVLSERLAAENTVRLRRALGLAK